MDFATLFWSSEGEIDIIPGDSVTGLCLCGGVFMKAFRRVSCVHGEVESLCGRKIFGRKGSILSILKSASFKLCSKVEG